MGALLAGLLFFLAGCGKIEVQLYVHEDATVDGNLVMAIPKEFLGGEDPYEDMISGMDPQITPSRYDDGTWVGMQGSFTGVPAAEVGQLLEVVGPVSLGVDGDLLTVTTQADLENYPPDAWGDPPPDISGSITFPGEVVASTGSTDGNTASWVLEPKAPQDFTATGSLVSNGQAAPLAPIGSGGGGGSGAGIPLWVWAIVAVALLGGLSAWLVVRRSRPVPVAAAGGDPSAGDAVVVDEAEGAVTGTSPAATRGKRARGADTGADEVIEAPPGYEPARVEFADEEDTSKVSE